MSGWGVVTVAAVMAVGLLGVLVPILPGVALIWAAALTYGLLDGFGSVGVVAILAITLLAVAGSVAKYVLPSRTTAAREASRWALALAAALGVVGFVVVPVVGLPLGAAAGLLLGEYRRARDLAAAWRATRAVLVGYGLGVLVELVAAVAMVAVWLGWVLTAR